MTKTIERAKRPPSASFREAPFKLVRDTTGDGGDGLTLDGYGAVFNSRTVIDSWEGRFVETIAPGSMKKSFKDSPPRIQYDHGRHPMIGSIPIASLRSITEDIDPVLAPDGGAHVVGRLLDNWLVQPVRDAIAADAINGMSFRFEVVRESWTYADGKPIKDDEALMVELRRTWDGSVADDDLPIRTLKELKIAEIGPVMWPAYDSTSVSVRGKEIIDLGRLHEPEQRKLLARAVFMADSAVGDPNGATRADDSEDGPAVLASALDVTLDQACDLIKGLDLSTLPPDVAQALSLLVAADTVSDELLEAMGIDDPDDDSAGETDSAPPSGTVRIDVDTPQPTTDRQVAAAGAVAGEHLSREMKDAPQPTTRQDAGVAGEHPSLPQKPRQRLSATEVAKEMARTRNVLLSIPK
jgi:phage head maturation protease